MEDEVALRGGFRKDRRHCTRVHFEEEVVGAEIARLERRRPLAARQSPRKRLPMSKINADWHKSHLMPKNPTDRQRTEWHYEHALHCGCRAITPSIANLLRANGFAVPDVPAA